jgi:transcriptional regulator with XRE-family HTH domain
MAKSKEPKATESERVAPTLTTARNIGQRIWAARIALDMNQSDFIRAMGVAHTTVRNWEDDVSDPSIEHLRKASEVLQVSTSWLLGEDVEVTEPQYEAWLQFLATDAGQSMTDPERKTLASIRFDEHLGPPTTQLYYGLLVGLRMRPAI